MSAVNGGRVAHRARYVAPLCSPAAVSIEQVKVPVSSGGVYTQSQVPESDGDGLHGAPRAAAICGRARH